MPTVPRREEGPVPGARRITASKTQAPVEAFGGGDASLAPAIRQAGNAGADFLVKLQLEANESAVQKAENAFMEGRISLENEFLQLQGEDAVGIPGAKDSASANFQTKMTELRATASENLSGAQSQAFEPRADRQSIQATSRIERHVGQQSMILADKTDIAGIKLNHMNAIRDYTSASSINTAINNIDIKLKKIADRKGYSREQASLARVETISNVHRGVIEQYIRENKPAEAKGYFKGRGGKKSGEMTPEDASSVDKLIQESTFLGKVQAHSDNIMKKHGQDPREAMHQARQIKDPDERQATEKEVKTRLSEEKSLIALEDQQNYGDVFNAVTDGKDIDNFMVTIQQLDPAQQKSLFAYSRELRTGEKRVTDFDFYYDLKMMASDPKTARDFLKIDLKRKWKHLGKTEFKEMVGIQAEMLSNSGKTTKALDGFMTTHQIVNNFANEVGIDTRSSASGKNRKKMSALRFETDRQVMDLQQRNGRKATNAEITAIVGSLVTVRNSGWISDDFAFEFTGTDKTVDVDDIPNSLRQRIERSMQENNIQVTDEAIIENFMAIQGQIRGTSK